jgi:hypothetical protein
MVLQCKGKSFKSERVRRNRANIAQLNLEEEEGSAQAMIYDQKH